MSEQATIKRRDDYERVVYAEVIVPEVPNTYGDVHTREDTRLFCELYMKRGYDMDLEHDNVSVADHVKVVESFIARKGDPDFIEGSWVIGVHIDDDDIWQKVLDGELNGFSHETRVNMVEIEIANTGNRVVSGVTEPDLLDGHTHTYTVIVDVLNRVVSGGTGETDGHMHVITRHTITDKASGHTHRYQVIEDNTGATP